MIISAFSPLRFFLEALVSPGIDVLLVVTECLDMTKGLHEWNLLTPCTLSNVDTVGHHSRLSLTVVLFH